MDFVEHTEPETDRVTAVAASCVLWVVTSRHFRSRGRVKGVGASEGAREEVFESIRRAGAELLADICFQVISERLRDNQT